MKLKKKKIDEERSFMNKTLGEIFSSEVSRKYTTNRDKDNFNKKIIDDIIKSNKELKDLKDIFNITFIDCLNHFMGHKKLELLSGMKEFKDIMVLRENGGLKPKNNKLADTVEDITEKNNLLHYSENYEFLLDKKKNYFEVDNI